MITGQYDMMLYCRNHQVSDGHVDGEADAQWKHDHGPGKAEYRAQTKGACVAQAKRDGWRFDSDGDVTCPECRK